MYACMYIKCMHVCKQKLKILDITFKQELSTKYTASQLLQKPGIFGKVKTFEKEDRISSAFFLDREQENCCEQGGERKKITGGKGIGINL